MRLTKILTATSTRIRFPSVRIHSVLPAIISLALFGHARAATITANSVSRADVGAAVASAVDGDTVIIPAGSAHWTTNLTISKAITLQGAGTNRTTGTVIYDDIPDAAWAYGRQASLFYLATTANKFYRLSGIHIATNTVRTGLPYVLGTAQVTVGGAGKAIRVDNCWFGATPNRQRAISWYDGTCGLVDHCTLLNTTRDVDFWSSSYGDNSWASDSTMGTTNTVVIEDCYMAGSSAGQAFTDCFDGGRYCVRYCTLVNGHLDSHEGGSRSRATRQIEVYNNNITVTAGDGVLLYARGGSVLVFSNKLTGILVNTLLASYRSYVPYPTWGMITGTNIWDNNAPSASATGSYNGADGATTVMLDSKAASNWTDNQWAGYTIQNTTAGRLQAWPPYQQMAGVILSNTKTNITTYNSGTGQLNWNKGDTYAIYYVTNALDACGMGKGDLISGDNPSPAGWPHQQLEPCYQWGNTPNLPFVAQFANVRENVHYYNNMLKPGYAPLIYPHPLQFATSGSGASNPPKVLPPSGLTAISPR